MKYKVLLVAPLVAAMGSGRPPDPPVRLEPRAAVTEPQPEPAPAAVPDEPAPELRVVPAAEIEPQALREEARPVVVFADSPQNPSFVQQMQALTASPRALIDRDVVVVTDTDPAANGAWRRLLRPEGFSLVIMDKDGQVKLRKPLPWSVREITRAIDKFPSRRQEIGRARMVP